MDLRDATVRQSPDEIITMFKIVGILSLCLVPTILILLLACVINRYRVVHRYKKIEKLYSNMDKVLELLSDTSEKPSNPIAYSTLTLEFSRNGKIIEHSKGDSISWLQKGYH